MCGIAGILSFRNKVDQPSLKQMTDCISHRGPDGSGFWIDDNAVMGLAHRRLAIIDLSENGLQPMLYAEGRYVISFNGEIYNYTELREDLAKSGHELHSLTDTEVILALYHLHQEQCLQYLDGMFAFAIWDNKEKTLFCARDRFGEKPFYYSHTNDEFIFGSEIKQLTTRLDKVDVDMSRVFSYFLYNQIENAFDRSSTFYSGIKQLQPAHFLKIDATGKVQHRQYWELDLQQEEMNFEEATSKFYGLFEESVRRRLRSDVPVGSSLSGGLDSSSIVMIIDQLKGQSQVQKTFSARFNNFEKDEGEFIEKVVNTASVDPYYTYPVAADLFDNLNKTFWHQEEPISTTSVSAQYQVMKLARENDVTVLLDGQGADEMLAGYDKYRDHYLMQIYLTDRKMFNQEMSEYAKLYGRSYPFSLVKKMRAYFPSLMEKAGAFKRKMANETSPLYNGIHPDLVKEFKHVKNPLIPQKSLSKNLKYSIYQKELGELLRYADKNSMAHSREVRLPFLSHELVQFTFSLPDRFKLNKGWTKYILRKAMESSVPDDIVWRKDKIGYASPQKSYMATTGFADLARHSIDVLKKNDVILRSVAGEEWKYINLYYLLFNNQILKKDG